MNFFKAFKSWVYPVVSQYFSQAVLAEGMLAGARQPFRCLFVDNASLAEYLLPKMYAESQYTVRRWRIWIPALERLVRKNAYKLDLCVAVLPLRYESTFQGLYAVKGREHVRQVIDTSGTWEEIRGRFGKTMRQLSNVLVSRYDLSYCVSKELHDFDLFYYRMHLPHVRKQYGDLSEIDSYEDMRRFFLRGFLILVKRGGQPIAGVLCLNENETLTFRRTGVLDGEEGYIKEGGQTALYYFALLYAKENGIARVDTMKSRSFMTDGVYQHKRRWGATVYPDDEAGSWVYFFHCGNPEKIAGFYERNPYIAYTPLGLSAVVGAKKGVVVSNELRSDLTQRFYSPGLRKMSLFTAESSVPIEVSLGQSRACDLAGF